MDQLNKAASEVEAKLRSGQEPISGKTGKGTAEQPYDQGNAEGTSITFSSIQAYHIVLGHTRLHSLQKYVSVLDFHCAGGLFIFNDRN